MEFDSAVAMLRGGAWTTSEEACEAIFAVARARWGYFLRLTQGHVQDAEDLLVDTVVNVMEPMVRNRRSMDYPVSYVLVSANHAWGRKNKSQSSERIALESYFQDVLRLAADGAMAQTVSAIEDQVILAQAIADLPDSERNAVLSHGLMDLSFADAADYLGVSKSTVQTTFNRGIRKLRQRLAPRSLSRGVNQS